LIIYELRGFTPAGILESWNTGMMEYPNWNVGIME
jgi:hypothetical protein